MALPKPITRREMYLSNMAGEDTPLPEKPITREEMYLNTIAEHGVGGASKASQLDNDLNWQTEDEVDEKIETALASYLKPGPSAAFASLPTLTEANLGIVTNVTDAFTTTASFVEGAGKSFPAGTNVAIVLNANQDGYLYDVLPGFVDLSGYVEKTQKIGNVALSGDIPVSLTGDSVITVTSTGGTSSIAYSVTHDDSGVTAGSKGDNSNQTPTFGGTFKAVSATVDAKGHVTALGDHTVTIPNAKASTTADGLMSKEDKGKLDDLSVAASDPLEVTKTGTSAYTVALKNSGVTAGGKGDTTNQTPGFGGTFKSVSATVDAKGRVTALADHTVTVPSATASSTANGLMSKTDKAKLDALNVTASDPLEVTKSGEVYTVSLKNSGVTAGSKGDTSNQTPTFGGTFKAVSATVDAKGRVTSFADHSVTLPSNTATDSTAGLMSAADKTALDVATETNTLQGKKIEQLERENAQLWEFVKNIDAATVKTATGNPVIIADGYNGAALVSAAVDSNLSGESITLTRYGVTRNGETNPASQTVTVGSTGAISTAITLTTLLGENVIYAYHGQTAVSLTVEYRADPRYMQYDTYPTGTSSGSPAAFKDGADAVPVKSMTLQIAPVQAGSGGPSPDNIRPIVGWGNVTITRTGKNLVKTYLGTTYHQGISYSLNADGSLKCEGTVAGNGSSSFSGGNYSSYESCPWKLPAGTYTVTVSGLSGNDVYVSALSIMAIKKGESTVQIPVDKILNETRTFTIDKPFGAWFWLYVRDGKTVSQNVRIQIERGLSATDYEPYRGETIEISTGGAGTVYGGTLNVTTGKLTVTHRCAAFTNGTHWNIGQAGTANQYYSTSIAMPGDNTKNQSLLCSHSTWASIWAGSTTFGISYYDNAVYFRDLTRFPTLADFAAWIDAQAVAGTPLQLVYELASPLTYQLTPQEVTTLLGVNTIAADGGAVSVTYRADTGLLYQNMTDAILSMGANI